MSNSKLPPTLGDLKREFRFWLLEFVSINLSLAVTTGSLAWLGDSYLDQGRTALGTLVLFFGLAICGFWLGWLIGAMWEARPRFHVYTHTEEPKDASRRDRSTDAPVRLCCYQRHYGPACPDGTVMCSLCFDKVPVVDVWTDETGQLWDLCKPCAALDGMTMRMTQQKEESP